MVFSSGVGDPNSLSEGRGLTPVGRAVTIDCWWTMVKLWYTFTS